MILLSPGYVQNGYIMLKNRPNPENNLPQIFAIDCEMVTTRSHDGKNVFHILTKIFIVQLIFASKITKKNEQLFLQKNTKTHMSGYVFL